MLITSEGSDCLVVKAQKKRLHLLCLRRASLCSHFQMGREGDVCPGALQLTGAKQGSDTSALDT